MSIRKRKVIGVTGARSEYDLLSPLFELLNNDAAFDFGLLVTGPHLSEKFGLTINQVEKDKFPILDRLYNLIDSDKRIGRITAIGHQINLISHSLNRIDPDLVLVAGDREEAISVTMSCAFMDIPCAHFFGGDIAKDGNIDNSVRYASSKFAHLHFVTLDQHKSNLIKLGEEEWRIHTIGNPALDKFLQTPSITKKEISERLGFDISNEPYLLLIQHSIITEADNQAYQIRQTLEAIESIGLKCLINYPNSDPGSAAIIEAYHEYASRNGNFHLFKNLDRETYINVLRNASCLVGNSSSGLLEAPSIGLPVVNVGNRQRGRLHGINVIFVTNNSVEIANAIKKCLYDNEFRKLIRESENPYGDGKSSARTVELLKSLPSKEQLLYKNITY